MGKFDAIVYGIDSDGNKHQIKYYNHLQDYEKFALGDNPDIEEAKNISLDSETIKQIKDDIKGFPKYQKRGFESFKKEVRERYKITPKQLEDILHRELTESKEDIRETIKLNILNKNQAGGLGGCRIKWNYENCKEEASKYPNRTTFCKYKRKAYNKCLTEGWLDEFFTK